MLIWRSVATMPPTCILGGLQSPLSAPFRPLKFVKLSSLNCAMVRVRTPYVKPSSLLMRTLYKLCIIPFEVFWILHELDMLPLKESGPLSPMLPGAPIRMDLRISAMCSKMAWLQDGRAPRWLLRLSYVGPGNCRFCLEFSLGYKVI